MPQRLATSFLLHCRSNFSARVATRTPAFALLLLVNTLATADTDSTLLNSDEN